MKKRLFSLFMSFVLAVSLIVVLPSMSVEATDDWETESNDTYQTADSISLGNTIKGNLKDYDDVGFYKFTPSANGKVNLTFVHRYEDTYGQWKITFYRYAENEYKYIGEQYVSVDDMRERITMPYIGAVKGGKYYIMVEGYSWEDRLIGRNYSISTKLSMGNVSGFKATSTSTNAVKLKWNKVSGASGYTLYQKKSGKWAKIKSLTGTSYTVPKLKAGTTYQFAVKAYKKVSGSTITIGSYPTVTTSTKPAKVSFKLSTGGKKATVKWSKSKGASGYIVYYKTSKNGKWIGLKTTNNKTTSYTKTGLTRGRTYWFTVRAYRTVGGKNYYGTFTTKRVKVK